MRKKYVKIIGSLIFALCMIATVALTTIGTEATNMEVVYIPDVVYTEDNTAPAIPEGYSDVLFAGWYENTGTEETPVYSPVKEPVINQSYCAKFVPKEVLSVQAQISGNIFNNDDVSDAAKNKIRFVTTIDDSLYYKKVGFIINVGGYWEEEVKVDEWVYEKIYAVGATEATDEVYYPNMISEASKYFKTYTFTNIPKEYLNTDITVTPYWDTLDGTRVLGTTSIKTVNLGRYWFYVDNSEGAVTNEDAPLGAHSNPYANLQEAFNRVEGNIRDPKVILKSDYELSAGVEVTKALTLASEGSKTISRADSWTDDRMLTVNADGKTVTLEDITINGKKLGACVELTKGTLHMLDGSTITNGKVTGSSYGANVAVEGGTLIMEDGSEISDGTTERHGGNVLLKGTLTMNGGTITGGKATAAETAGKNYGCGGNIHAYGSSVINLDGGTVSNGTASTSSTVVADDGYGWTGLGGNICSTGKINIDGGTISGGTATTTTVTPLTGNGGNVFANGTLVMKKGTVINGKAETNTSSTGAASGYAGCGGNIYNVGNITIKGGTISTGTAETKTKQYYTGCGGNIFSATSFTIDGADTVNTEDAIVITNGSANAPNANNNYGLGGNIFMQRPGSGTNAVNVSNATITGGYAKGRGGSVNLFGNATLTLTEATITGGNTDGNGGNVFAQGGCSITLNAGGVISGGTASSNGGNIAYNASGKLITLGEGCQITGGEANQGGSIYLQKGTLKIQGGTISGGTATTNGGNVYNQEGTINMTEGTISGGTATTNGGNVYLLAKQTNASTSTYASMTMENATISGGKATLGGNIYIDRGIFEAEDGTYTSTPATMTMNDGTIENGWATGTKDNGGGNIYCVGTFTMNGGTIKEGKAGSSTNSSGRGGNIYVYRGESESPYDHAGKIIISAGEILNGRATNIRGANIMLDHGDMEIKPTGVIKITGGRKAVMDESGNITSVTGSASNIELYSNTSNLIFISGNLVEDSVIGIRINGTVSTATTIATIDTTVTQDATTIAQFFQCGDSTKYEIKGAGTTLTYGPKTE